MRRPYLAASLMLAAVVGCSSSTPTKSAEQPAPAIQPTLQSVSAAAPAPPPSAVPAPAPKPAPKAAAHKDAKSEKGAAGSPTDRLAKCLTEKGAVMYGVFWCDHCRDQKEKFGDSFKYVHYVECVTKDNPRTLIPECKAQGITHTPTWVFADGSRMEGSQLLATLAQKAGCKAP